ncbi:hypothetical protein [Salinirubrum litoreum]|uniref:Uncharacterized protein n=1 Tax=Salinirubrum litoreum TaxID=1126234 RepID=A0ABD5RF77_9EURY|nr:hypothetical protein [Salinirubrum litoreum]
MVSFPGGAVDDEITETASYMAEQTCLGFIAHDDGRHGAAVDAFYEVDRRQFSHVGDEAARRGATAFVDALWAKDAIEAEHRDDAGALARDDLRGADWTGVERRFRERADALGIAPDYAWKSTDFWRNHKVGGDYWTPALEAQVYEIRAAVRDAAHPEKPSDGQSGYGPEATRYLLGVELHDMHTEFHWRQAREVMTPYFEFILREHRDSDLIDTIPTAGSS